jgi:hypothetical protein
MPGTHSIRMRDVGRVEVPTIAEFAAPNPQSFINGKRTTFKLSSTLS